MPDDGDGVLIVFGDEMGVAADRRVHFGAADFLHRRRAAGDGLDDFRSGQAHVGIVPRHDDEIHQRRGVGRATRAGAADDSDLGNNAGEQDVVVEHLAVAGKRIDTFLDTRTARVLESNHRHPDFRRILHGTDDLLCVHLAERPGQYREILAEGGNLLAANVTGAGDHTVGRQIAAFHAEILGAVTGIQAGFLEGILIEERHQAFTGGKRAFGMQRLQLFRCGGLQQVLALLA